MAFQAFYVALFMLSFFFPKNSFVSSIPSRELDAMLSIARSRGYNLFSNAITTSDLQFDLLTASLNASFTFFAPTDSSLFALAMTHSASAYTATLRYHGLPRRLSVSYLNRLPSQVSIHTLLPSHYVSLTRRIRPRSRSHSISVNGVNVVLPGLYYGRHVAVHGLDGILSLHSQIGFPYPSPTPYSSFRHSAAPLENRDFTAPASDSSIVFPPVSPSNSSNETVQLPFNREFLGPAPERSDFQVEPPEISSVSPSKRPVLPPVVTNDLSPSIQNKDAITPTPLMSDWAAWMMKSEDDMSGRTVEEYEPLDWMTFGFTEENSRNVDIEDSHPRPNVLQSL